MRIIVPIIGTTAIIVQLIRLLPFTFTALLSALVTGGVFYITCKLGWDTQKGSILKNGYKGWGDWCKRALLGMTVFLTLSLALLFFSFHNPICEDTGDPFYGRCEKFAVESIETNTGISFNLGRKVYYPLLLAIAFVAGSAATRIEHIRKKGGHDRRIRPRKY
ncbi:MAG: hypothetical protein HKP41_06585 [Desulfobacterales bacterium]|nr:hypothetical protein [Desulfobacterales bacterium]